MSATVADLIKQGHEQLADLKVPDPDKHDLAQTLDAINTPVLAARAKVSEALTILRDPTLANRPIHVHVVAAELLDQAMRWLNGEATVADS